MVIIGMVLLAGLAFALEICSKTLRVLSEDAYRPYFMIVNRSQSGGASTEVGLCLRGRMLLMAVGLMRYPTRSR